MDRRRQEIARVVHDGDSALQHDTALDRALLHKAATVMDTEWWQSDAGSNGQTDHREQELAPFVSDMFDAAARDHHAVHWILTGADDHRTPDIPADEPVKDFLRNVTQHAWADNGAAAGRLFVWTGEAATGAEAAIAGETASTYA